jgi:hypothetical protein
MNRTLQRFAPLFPGPATRALPQPLPARRDASWRRHGALACALLFAVIWVAPVHASQLVPQNLKQMIRESDVIVTGDVVKVTDGIEKGIPYTEVTMKVSGSVKRDMKVNSSFVFRQYGLQKTRRMSDGRYLLPTKIEGMATWTVGEKVTTFMNRPVGRSGMRTPVGMAQGKFTYSGSRAANSFDNRGLFQGVTVKPGLLSARESAMLAKSSGAVEGDVLLNLVRRAVAEQWIEKGVMR